MGIDIPVSYAGCKADCRVDTWFEWKKDKEYLESSTIKHIHNEWRKGHINLLIDSDAYRKIFVD